MAYKILYIEDQNSDSRADDLRNLGFEVEELNPSSDIKQILDRITSDINALILDYRLTEGDNGACFDAPTIAQTIRSKHSESTYRQLPIALMSNQEVITNYYKNFTSKDLFDFVLTKQNFNDDKENFKKKLESFIKAYRKILEFNFDVRQILNLNESDNSLIDSRIITKLNNSDIEGDVFAHSSFIYEHIICSVGPLIGEDILSARLGVAKESEDWGSLLEELASCRYSGEFSDIHSRWWMAKVELWWNENINSEERLRRLNAQERVNCLKGKFRDKNLTVANETNLSKSSNFWTICKEKLTPLDPFDGIELLNDYFPWEEKEYISFEFALSNPDKYKNKISAIDKKEIRELAQTMNNG